jgi:hypothetical protein
VELRPLPFGQASALKQEASPFQGGGSSHDVDDRINPNIDKEELRKT